MKIETLAARAGTEVDPTTGAVTLPIHLSTTFQHEPDGAYPRGYLYTRNLNPNRASLERCLAALEGGIAAAAFSSGSAATIDCLSGPEARRPRHRPHRGLLGHHAALA